MIIYEDGELEQAFFDGELPIAVMLSAELSADGSFQVSAYYSAKDIAKEYLARFGNDPFSAEAVSFVTEKAREYYGEHNYDCEEADILCEFIPRPGTEVPVLSDATLVLGDGLSLAGYENLLEAELDDGICATVCVGNSIVCAAGLNDYFESDICEIYVECAAKYRRRGYAKAAVLALCKYLFDMGAQITYKTYSSNEPSVHLARSCGFIPGSMSLNAVGYSRFEEDIE